jgi:hypothetical protein
MMFASYDIYRKNSGYGNSHILKTYVGFSEQYLIRGVDIFYRHLWNSKLRGVYPAFRTR